MASYHLSIKSGKKGTAVEHANYIAREGKFRKGQKREDLLVLAHGNLPEWANNNPAVLWKMADKHERKNGAAYREFEMALPHELTLEQNLELFNDFIRHEVGNKPYQFAIHAPMASLGKVVQTHGHLMVSDRIPDDIIRLPEQHFRRYNSAHPELGGCKKDSGGKDRAAMREHAISIRSSFADYQNKYLAKYGHAARVDHRSNRDRGLTSEPEQHLGSSAISKMTSEEKEQYKAKRSSKNQHS